MVPSLSRFLASLESYPQKTSSACHFWPELSIIFVFRIQTKCFYYRHFTPADVFIGYHSDTTAAIISDVWEEGLSPAEVTFLFHFL